jgi:hypothetical protein
MSIDYNFGNCAHCGENESMRDSDVCKECSMCVMCGKFPMIENDDVCQKCKEDCFCSTADICELCVKREGK